MIYILKKHSWVYVLGTFSLLCYLPGVASSSQPDLVIDWRIVEPITLKAQRLYPEKKSISELTAEEYATTLSSLIYDTEKEEKHENHKWLLANLVCEEAADWLSGKYGFSTQAADDPILATYSVLAAQIRFFKGVTDTFEDVYQYQEFYTAKYQDFHKANGILIERFTGHFAFLRNTDDTAKALYCKEVCIEQKKSVSHASLPSTSTNINLIQATIKKLQELQNLPLQKELKALTNHKNNSDYLKRFLLISYHELSMILLSQTSNPELLFALFVSIFAV
jgi:hypothetical protein